MTPENDPWENISGHSEEGIRKKIDISVFSGVIFMILQLKFRHFSPLELEIST